MKIELDSWEIWNLLKEGSTNQRNFINSLRYCEFQEFIEIIEDYDDFDLRGYLNGGCLFVEDTPKEEEFIIWRNDRISIVLI